MSLPCIPFLAQGSEAQRQSMLAPLVQAMPAYTIKPFEQLSPAEKQAATVAIVANPDPAEVAELPNLVWLQSLWAGVERLLLELPDTSLKIVRLIDPRLSEVMAEAVLAWSFYLHRQMPQYALAQRQKRWQPLPYTLAAERRVSVFGLGELGRAAAQRLAANGFRVNGWSRRPKSLDGVHCFSGTDGFSQCLAKTDVAVCLLPLTPATRGLFDQTALSQLPDQACLINFARGGLVDQAALLGALASGRLQHAVLDVFEQEPLPSDSPLWINPRITVLPHISGPTDPHSAAEIVAANLCRYAQTGQVPPSVSRQNGY